MLRVWIPLIAAIAVGCAGTRQKVSQSQPERFGSIARVTLESEPSEAIDKSQLQLTSYREREASFPAASQSEVTASSQVMSPIPSIINAVYQSYPLLEAALYSREVASGDRLETLGEFDRKLKAGTENGPMGYYKTYRQHIGLIQPLNQGGEVFAGYRIGRGSFQPWYLERQTNEGGEFKAGFSVPLSRNRNIDARRAALWRATYGVEAVEPDIQAQLIAFVQEGTYAYWDWVAAGAKLVIADRILRLAQDRTDRIRSQVDNGFLDPPELTDNLRLVAERLGKRAFAERKLQQAAIKLSLYYRDVDGKPLIPDSENLPRFPELENVNSERVALDAKLALERRPEIYAINLLQHQLNITPRPSMILFPQ